jgi:hypothetical protein
VLGVLQEHLGFDTHHGPDQVQPAIAIRPVLYLNQRLKEAVCRFTRHGR